tara:strand:- start:55 stop:885 length:831 start_codon:yes stop_codon:yes gene_type:complete
MATQQQLKSCEYCGGYGDEDEYKCDNCGRPLTKLDTDEYGALYSFNDERKVEEEEDPYSCVDCGKDFKWKSGTSSAGASVNDYHCGSCVEEEFNGCCADCDDEEKKECRDCKIEAKKHCELCCGYECEVEEEEVEECWTCRVSPAKNQTYRDALGEMELTCDSCHREEYPEQYCDDCEGQCRADETEECEDCKIKLRIGCANNPSNHSIFDGCCDDCREEVEEYCYKNSTIDTYQNDNCVCSVGGCIKPTEFDMVVLDCREEEEEVISEWHEAQGR